MPRGVTDRYRSARSFRGASPVSVAGRDPAAARLAGVQRLRAALSRSRRLGARRRPADGHRATGTGSRVTWNCRRQELPLAARRLRGAPVRFHRGRRWSYALAHRDRALPAGAGSRVRRAVPLLPVSYGEFAADFISGYGEEDVDRPRLLTTLKSYLQANNLNADWDRINGASNERLVNTLSILSPYGAEEKQALLEAPDLKARPKRWWRSPRWSSRHETTAPARRCNDGRESSP